MNVVKRALISVSDKSGVVEFAKALSRLGVEILSTGGTAALLRENGLEIKAVSDYTGFPEIMGGRVKTLHPKIHGGLLGRRGTDDDVMAEHGIDPIDLLVVNLYPFEETIAKPGCTLADAIENIDIGGPAMIRAAAKNHNHVAVAVDAEDYATVLEDMRTNDGAISDQVLFILAVKAFAHTARYDTTVTSYLSKFEESSDPQQFPETFTLNLRKSQDLRYGENPHQRAAFYVEPGQNKASLGSATIHQGKQLSYNNIMDGNAALECVKQFYEPACVIVKHANPCGVAVDEDILQAYKQAYSTDTTSAFGGIIAFNRKLDAETADAIGKRQFVEVIIAPEVDDTTLEVLAEKPNVRVLTTGWWDTDPVSCMDYRRVHGGLLVQSADDSLVNQQELVVATDRSPDSHEMRDLLFAWKVVKYVKSNAIVFAKDQMTIGIGAGQMSRVYSTRVASMKAVDAGLAVNGSVMASDAFFPFPDSIDKAAEQGVTAVIQPGGSKRDDEVIAAANEKGIAMVFSGMRHFRH